MADAKHYNWLQLDHLLLWSHRFSTELCVQNNAKSKKTNKSKRPKDEEYTKNKKGRKQPHPKQKWIAWKNKENLNISLHFRRLIPNVLSPARTTFYTLGDWNSSAVTVNTDTSMLISLIRGLQATAQQLSNNLLTHTQFSVRVAVQVRRVNSSLSEFLEADSNAVGQTPLLLNIRFLCVKITLLVWGVSAYSGAKIFHLAVYTLQCITNVPCCFTTPQDWLISLPPPPLGVLRHTTRLISLLRRVPLDGGWLARRHSLCRRANQREKIKPISEGRRLQLQAQS